MTVTEDAVKQDHILHCACNDTCNIRALLQQRPQFNAAVLTVHTRFSMMQLSGDCCTEFT